MTVTIKMEMAAVSTEVDHVINIEGDLGLGLEREEGGLDQTVEIDLLEDLGLEAETNDLEVDLETETGVKVKVMIQ